MDTGNRGLDGGNKNYTYDNKNYLYDSYRPSGRSRFYVFNWRKKLRDNPWAAQLLISAGVLLLVLGLFKTSTPILDPLKSGVRYLMTAETDIRPYLYKVVQLASQAGNLEWPLIDDTPQGSQPAVSVTSGVLMLPVSGRVVRTFGWAVQPGQEVQEFHEGLDIAADPGSEVRASAGGTVRDTGENSRYGKYVLVETASGELMRYANLSEVLIDKGKTVKTGDAVAKVGAGSNLQSYLHFEIIAGGRPIDPLYRLGIDPAETGAGAGAGSGTAGPDGP